MWGKNRNLDIDKLLKDADSNVQIIANQNLTIGELRKELDDLKSDYLHYREDCNIRFRRLNQLIEEKLDIQKEETESLLIGLTKTFENKVNTISGGTNVVTDLLKKIAVLESIKKADDGRRSTENILEKIQELDTIALSLERQDKSTNEIREKIGILKWVLGQE